MKRPNAWLASRFQAGARPTAQDFQDLLDSFVHIDLQAAVDATVVNQAIGLAVAGLTSRNNDGIVNSLGDMFAVFAGYAESDNLASRLLALTNAAKWSGLPGKPAQAALVWTEQIISCGPYDGFLPTSSRKWLLADVAGVSSALILDMNVKRVFQPWATTGTTSFDQGYIMDSVMQVKIAVQPKIALT